jgi:hypothetical protein
MAKSQHSALTSTDLHEPKGADSASANTVYVMDGAGSGVTQKITLDQLDTDAVAGTTNILTHNFEDISTARSAWIVAPFAGTLSKIWSVVDGTTSVAACVFTFELGGTAVTGGTLTIASGAVAGTVDSATPSALNTVTAGQAIEIISDGGSTGTVAATLSFEIVPS